MNQRTGRPFTWSGVRAEGGSVAPQGCVDLRRGRRAETAAEPVEHDAAVDVVLLRPLDLERQGGHQAAELSGALQGQPAHLAGKEAGPEGVPDAGRIGL